ncbi:MAG: agmatine deiminase family protein [Candidatus Fermentibacteraceae bacterium]|nr:agmatine deiminase family protein [Candidatus Fermentibacteraceae bacterium]
MKYAFPLMILAMAASAEMSVCGTEELLPIGFTDEELTRLDEIGMNASPTSPPPAGTVNPGEFDPATGVFVRWPLGLPYELIVALSQETMVWVICESSQQGSVASAFTAAGVNMSNVDYVFAPTNSMWVRDYGPWFVLLEDGTQGIFDYVYNRPRPLDDLIPGIVGAAWGIPVYASTIEHTGGNYMSSGFGQAMSTTLVYQENGGNQGWVDSQMLQYLGIDNYVTMEDPLTYVSIDHIDCWAKMLSPDRVLVLQLPPSSPSYAALEASADMLASTVSPYGTDWEVVRIASNGSEGYTNSLICNDHVYVPLFGSDLDAAALDVYDTAMPGYTVQGFQYGGWLPDDALHCRTRNVMDNEMLFIRHVPVEDPQPAGVPVTVDARILCHPSNSLTDHDVFYRVGTSGSFAELAMSSTGSDSFTADIPGVPGSQTVQYYIAASDDSGRDEAMPRFAPDTWFFQYQTSATGIGGGGAADAGVFLANAGPNPFRSIVSLGYSVSSTVSVTFSVMDISGRMVYCGESGLEAGSGSLTWVPDDDTPAGMYVLRVEGPDWSHAQRVTLIR